MNFLVWLVFRAFTVSAVLTNLHIFYGPIRLLAALWMPSLLPLIQISTGASLSTAVGIFLPSEGQFQGYLIPQWNFLILLNQCNPSLLWEPQLYLCIFWNQSIHVRSAPVLVCEVIWTPISSKGTQLHRTHSAERLLCDSILWRWFSFSIVSDSCNPILMSGYIIINMIWQWARTFRTEMSPNHPDCILCFR